MKLKELACSPMSSIYTAVSILWVVFVLSDLAKNLAKGTGVKTLLIVISCGIMLIFAIKCLRIFFTIIIFKYKTFKLLQKEAKTPASKVHSGEALPIENFEHRRGEEENDIEKQVEERASLIDNLNENDRQ